MNSEVITEAEIPTKIFYYVDETLKASKIDAEDVLPDSLDSSHENKYYYNNTKNKLYLVIKNEDGSYKAEEIVAKGVLPDPLDENHADKYYYTYEGAKTFPIGVSSFDKIWGTITDSEGNPMKDDKNENIIINLQDAMNALYKMMISQSHVWVGNESDAPRYAKLLIETGNGNSTNNN